MLFLLSFSVVVLFWILWFTSFCLQAIWAVLLLEATNYIEHYGLLRSKINQENMNQFPISIHGILTPCNKQLDTVSSSVAFASS